VAEVSETPSSLVDKVVKACFSIFIATIALACAVSLLKSILPILIPIAGFGAVVWVGVVVYKAWRERW